MTTLKEALERAKSLATDFSYSHINEPNYRYIFSPEDLDTLVAQAYLAGANTEKNEPMSDISAQKTEKVSQEKNVKSTYEDGYKDGMEGQKFQAEEMIKEIHEACHSETVLQKIETIAQKWGVDLTELPPLSKEEHEYYEDLNSDKK